MNFRKIQTPFLLSFLILLSSFGLAGYVILVNRTPSPQDETSAGDPQAPTGSAEKFAYLASQTSNTCGLQAEGISSFGSIQGSCCAPMDLHTYQEQVEALKTYAEILQIPPDPYDVSAEQARELLTFKEEIELTAPQQNTYQQAAELSEEGGPCCCQCWHWDAYEGLAKYLITDLGWGAQQVADLWDMSSACGGAGHNHT